MIYKSEQRDIRMTLTGDTMLSRRLRSFTEPDYQALVALMRRHGFVNYPRECCHFTYGDAETAPVYDVEID